MVCCWFRLGGYGLIVNGLGLSGCLLVSWVLSGVGCASCDVAGIGVNSVVYVREVFDMFGSAMLLGFLFWYFICSNWFVMLIGCLRLWSIVTILLFGCFVVIVCGWMLFGLLIGALDWIVFVGGLFSFRVWYFGLILRDLFAAAGICMPCVDWMLELLAVVVPWD